MKPATAKALALACLSVGLAAPAAGAENDIETVTVTAARVERSITDVAGTVSVIGSDAIEENLIRDIRDLVRYEPGISVAGGGRYGLDGFSIRGIGGDRVLTEIDGSPTSEEFSFGPFLSARRDFVDVDALKAVEIIRGPASSLYGSKALGGVVSFLTKDPADYLAATDRPVYFSTKGGYTSQDNGAMASATVAAGNEAVQGMLLYTRREGEQTDTKGGGDIAGAARGEPDPLEFATQSVLAKLTFSPPGPHRVALTAERFEHDSSADILSSAGDVVRGVVTTSSLSDDARSRSRFSLAHEYRGDHLLLDRIRWQLHRQDSETTQITRQRRVARGAPQSRLRESLFSQETAGFGLQLDRSFVAGDIGHTIVYGLEHEKTDSVGIRDGGTFDPRTGAEIREFAPLPTRDFPLSETTESAVYLQDEMALLDGALLLTPGVRYDRFALSPAGDDVYRSGNPGAPPPEDFEDDEVTFRLGAVYRLDNGYSLFAQFSQGFRAPSFDDVNVGFASLIGGYAAVPNPDLVSETSDSYEVGLRSRRARSSVSLAVFHNDYENFIESLAPRGFNRMTGLIELQSVNRGEASIRGVEFKGDWDIGGLTGLTAQMSLAYARGENEETGRPLNSIDPLKAVIGLAYRPGADWRAQLVLTAARGKKRIDHSAAVGAYSATPSYATPDPAEVLRGAPRDAAYFATPGYATLDLLGEYRIGERATLNAGLFNLTDRKYWSWRDVTGREADDPALDRFSRPGVNGSVSLRVVF